MDFLSKKTFQNDWNLGSRTIFMAKRGLSRMALYRKRAHLKSLPEKNLFKKNYVSDNCRFSSWNMSFCVWKPLFSTTSHPRFSPPRFCQSSSPPQVEFHPGTQPQDGMARWNFGSRIRIASMRYFQDASCRSCFLSTVIVCSSFICILYI